MRKLRWSLALMSAFIFFTLAACEKAGEKPTPTPDHESIQAVGTLFAQPTRATRPTPTITPIPAVELDLNRVIARMEKAVLAQEVDTYMQLILSDNPVFLMEHTRWAQDWVDHPLAVFSIELFSIRSVDPDTARARMTIRWSRLDETSDGSAGGATVSAIFRRKDGEWLWGGEDWAFLETEGVRLHYFNDPAVNISVEADTMMEYLPGIYTLLTREFDYAPEQVADMKLYENAATLQTMTRISQPEITSWNQPGEAIKVTLDSNSMPPPEPVVARHFTRYLLYQMAGGTHGNFPWWLEEGFAAFGEAQFRTYSQRSRIIKGIAALALDTTNAEEQLAAWADLDVRPAWGDTARLAIANQAFTLVQYVTDAFGQETRNAWMQAMATDQTLEVACEAHLGISFEELDAQWRAWLVEQL